MPSARPPGWRPIFRFLRLNRAARERQRWQVERVIKSPGRRPEVRQGAMSASLEIAVRVAGAAVVFGGMALWEWLAPRRVLSVGRQPRWPGNLGILVIDILAVRLLVPATAVGV